MEMVVATKVTYKYLMNQSKHDLAQMVLDLLKKEEMQNNDLASVCRVSYHVFVDGVCAECGPTKRASDGLESPAKNQPSTAEVKSPAKKRKVTSRA